MDEQQQTQHSEPTQVGPAVGVDVEVHVDYSGTWEPGFSVAESLPDGLRLRRRSDLQVLPLVFDRTRVRPVNS